jgi:hypothetical protein
VEKKKQSKKIILIIGIIAIAGVLLFGPILLAGNKKTVQTETVETPVYSVRTVKAEFQDLKAYLDINGDIVSTQQTDVFPDAAGKLIGVSAALDQSGGSTPGALELYGIGKISTKMMMRCLEKSSPTSVQLLEYRSAPLSEYTATEKE